MADPSGLPTSRQAARLAQALREKGVASERVLAALQSVPREHFVEPAFRARAYADEALPIGLGQTISQPSTVAAMTELLAVEPGDRVLEIGTGSGYQAAVLVALGARVFSVERHADLLERAATLLERLGVRVRTRVGDGTLGWPALAPFDAVLVTAGGPEIPPALLEQLREPVRGRADARLVIPVGPRGRQTLTRVTRTAAGLRTETFSDVVFVPLVGGR